MAGNLVRETRTESAISCIRGVAIQKVLTNQLYILPSCWASRRAAFGLSSPSSITVILFSCCVEARGDRTPASDPQQMDLRRYNAGRFAVFGKSYL